MNLKLKDLRKAAGLQQGEVAEKLGIKTRTYGSWERGEAILNAEQLCDVCDAIGCTPDDAVGWWDEHERPADPQGLTSPESALLANYRLCDAERRSRLDGEARDSARLSSGPSAQDPPSGSYELRRAS